MAERHFTNDHKVLNRATWSGRQGSLMLLGQLITRLVPSEATIELPADDTVEHRSGRKIEAKGCHSLFRAEVGRDNIAGTVALELARVGVAVPHRAVLARIAERPAPAQNEYRWGGAADDETQHPLVAGPPASVGP